MNRWECQEGGVEGAEGGYEKWGTDMGTRREEVGKGGDETGKVGG